MAQRMVANKLFQLASLVAVLGLFLGGVPSVHAVTPSGVPEVGFQLDAQRAYSPLYYRSTFTNLNRAQLGTLNTFISPGAAAGTESGSRGCVGSPTCAGVLVLLPVCPTSPWYTCVMEHTAGDDGKAACVLSALKDASVPLDAMYGAEYDIALVLDADSTDGAFADTRKFGLNYTVVLAAIAAYNRVVQTDGGVTVTSLLSSPSRGWLSHGQQPLLPAANLSLVFFDMHEAESSVEDDWMRLVSHATFNMRRWGLGYTFPMGVIEVRNPAPALVSMVDCPSCCLNSTAAAGPACVPVGGWTVWAAVNANTSWTWCPDTRQFVRRTPPAATAVFVPYTVASLAQSGQVTTTEGPASAIVAALVALDAIHRLSDTLGISPAVYVFFVPAESVGNVGSGRLLYDAYFQPPCTELGPEACNALLYGDHLNFTTLDFSRVHRAVVVDHVHQNPDAPYSVDTSGVCYQVDGRVLNGTDNPILKRDMAVLSKVHVARTNQTVLRWSPARVYTLFREASQLGNVSALTLSSSALCMNRREPVAIGATNVSTRDRIQKAALAITQLVLADGEFADGLDLPASAVDTSLIDGLFECFTTDLSCSLLAPQEPHTVTTRPDYAFAALKPGSADYGRLAKALEAALTTVDVVPSRSVATPARLRVPRQSDSALVWNWADVWPLAPGPLDAVLVESVVPSTRGARLTTVASRADSTMAFFCALGSVIVVSLLLFCHVTR